MPSIEISLSSDDSPCLMDCHRTSVSSRGRSGSPQRGCMMELHNDQLVTDDTNLADHVAKHLYHNSTTENGGGGDGQYQMEEHSIVFTSGDGKENQYFHDIIEINNNEMDDHDGDDYDHGKEVLVAEDDDSILEGTLLLRNGGRRGRNSRSNGVINRFASVIRENFASRVSMSPAAESSSLQHRRPPISIRFLDHRI